jgi:hypothetical protein
MTTKEKMMQVSSEYICNMVKERNAGTEDCMTSSELARVIGIPVSEMHEILIKKSVLCRKHRKLRLPWIIRSKDMKNTAAASDTRTPAN